MMYQLKDENGNVVRGLAKDEKGSIVVTDTTEFTKYKREKQLILDVENLKKEISHLKDVVAHLLMKNS